MKTVFIMINYNDYDNVVKMINNVSNYNVLDKIVVVDNCSTDDSYSKLEEIQNKKLILLKNSSNKGYGSGINIGAKYIEKIYDDCNFIISNTDIEINDEDQIKRLIKNKKGHGIIGPVIKEHTGYNIGWNIPNPKQECLLNMPTINKVVSKKILNKNMTDEFVFVEALSGSFFVIGLKDLKKIKYFDENVFLYYEENIISKKLKKINKDVVLYTKSYVFHNHSVVIDKAINKINKFKILKESQRYFNKKYNNASKTELMLLNITYKITLFGMNIKKVLTNINK